MESHFMNKTLIIAEKPSVANDIAEAIGGFTKQSDYFESDQYVLYSAAGHLLEIAVPNEYNIKRGKWTFANLPIIPPCFILNPIVKTESRLKIIIKLIKRKDIIALINACDAGREGELIFRLIAQHANIKQPIKRLWLQSMTPSAIRDGFKKLRSNEEMLPLADAARCRSEADWLIGINGTRAMTAFNSKEGGFYLTTVGRVQTPTLSIVVRREKKIKKFIPRAYWEISAEFICATGTYKGRWFDKEYKKDNLDLEKRPERLWNKELVDLIVATCRYKLATTVLEKSKKTTQMPPSLFDLTSLQREANLRFSFSAKNTLNVIQNLYETHKVITYPRTDSKFLPEDYIDLVQKTLVAISENLNDGTFIKKIFNENLIKPNKRIFDNTKISDHFAIIPTAHLPTNLSESEQKLYDLIRRRFISVFFPAAEFCITTRYTNVCGYLFKTEGKFIIKAGWLEVYGKNVVDIRKPNDMLLPIADGGVIKTNQITVSQFLTKSPARYTDGTLLFAMESAGKLIDSEELRDAISNKGLGTPATRAAIIEGLLHEKYLVREGREIVPTAKAFQLIILLRGLGINELTEPELTGEWEYKLTLMELGKISRDEFMREIIEMAQIIVKRAKEYNNDTIPGEYITLKAPCPNCLSAIKENYRRFACINCMFSISKIPGGRQFEILEIEQLLINKKIGPLQGFRSKIGRPFSAILKIVASQEKGNFKLEFDFCQTLDINSNTQIVDLHKKTSLGQCPKCKSAVYDMELAYVCEKTICQLKACDFYIRRVILQQEILPEQMIKLLNHGYTDVLSGFVSRRTHRSFRACLTCDQNGKTSFKFEKCKLKM